MLGILYGYKVFTSPHVTQKEIKRWCRSKKKRIRKKWAKNPKNYNLVPGGAVIFGDNILIHPSFEKELNNKLSALRK